MSNGGLDEDTTIVIVVALAAAACAAFAVRRFGRGRRVAGVVWSIAAAVLAFIAYFFATFTIRMF